MCIKYNELWRARKVEAYMINEILSYAMYIMHCTLSKVDFWHKFSIRLFSNSVSGYIPFKVAVQQSILRNHAKKFRQTPIMVYKQQASKETAKIERVACLR